jgi:hypothetical protein
MELYTRWLNTSSIVEKFPTFSSVDCYENKDSCMLTSRMAMSKDIVALARREEEDRYRRGLFWDTSKLVTEIHYKTYHWLGEGDEREYAGFEQYITWDWNVSHCTARFEPANLPLLREQCLDTC